MRTIDEFRQYYEQTIKPDLVPLEEKRKIASRRIKRYLLACLVIAVASLTTMGLLRVHPLVMAVTFFSFVVATAMGGMKLSGGIEEEIKRVLLARTVSFLCPDVAYDPKGAITRDMVFDSGVLDGELPDPYRAGNPLDTALNQVARRFDRSLGLDRKLLRQAWKRVACSGGDTFKGRIGNREMLFGTLHVHAPRERGPGAGGSLSKRSGPRNRTIFRGLFYTSDTGQQYRGRTLVRPLLDASFARSGMLQKAMTVVEHLDGAMNIEGEVVKFNDAGFDGQFMVHATDPSAARVLLTPELRKRFVDIRAKHGLPFRASYTGTMATCAVHHANMFEANPRQNALDFALARRYFDEVRLALQIAEDLVS